VGFLSILWRSWLTFSAVIAAVLAILTSLPILQHDTILSGLIRDRIAVVAHTTASSFRAIVDMFDPAGTKLYSTTHDRAAPVPPEVLRAQKRSWPRDEALLSIAGAPTMLSSWRRNRCCVS